MEPLPLEIHTAMEFVTVDQTGWTKYRCPSCGRVVAYHRDGRIRVEEKGNGLAFHPSATLLAYDPCADDNDPGLGIAVGLTIEKGE